MINSVVYVPWNCLSAHDTHTKWQLHAMCMCMVLVITISIGCVHHVHYYVSKVTVLHVNPHYVGAVEVDVKCMQTKFGGHGLSGFGDIATLKNGKFPFFDHGL